MLSRVFFMLLLLTLVVRATPLASLKITILGFRQARRYSLTCDPTGGSHTAADGACDILDDIGGNISSLPTVSANGRSHPVYVSIEGYYHHKPVQFFKNYRNEATAITELDGLYPEEED
ncbi:hypothetical protein A0J61_09055 [Choanephora cucurbitarum]|uniref:Subtilisin inhibitor domain-containing protein n=1 Tax=Choanephora cucurbitarum TaxID=101091 RepID=A0A1C7N1C9_9FUNG|nr:hypothetical protein A0J61_09055 [Choanephora cucurbitarum]